MQAVASTRWAQIALHEKPCVLLNSDGYYDYLFKFLDHAVAEGLLKGKNRALALPGWPRGTERRIGVADDPVLCGASAIKCCYAVFEC